MGRTAKLMTIVLTLGAWTTTGVSGQSAGNAGGTVDAEALAFVDAWIEALGGMEAIGPQYRQIPVHHGNVRGRVGPAAACAPQVRDDRAQ